MLSLLKVTQVQGSYHVPAIVAMLEKIYRSDTLGICRITFLTGSEIRVINMSRKSGLENRVGKTGSENRCEKSGSEMQVGNPGQKSGFKNPDRKSGFGKSRSEIRVRKLARKSGSEIRVRNPRSKSG
jgi:hypothetical protein